MLIISNSQRQTALGTEQRQGRGLTLSTHALVWLTAVGVVTVLLALHPDINLRALRLPLGLTINTIALVGMAFLVFLSLFVLVNLAWALSFEAFGRFRLALIALAATFLTVLVATNSAPLGVYLQYLKHQELSTWTIKLVALLFANAMLYYFFYGFFLDVYNESKQLYVKSAIFKGAGSLNYLREHAAMAVLASMSPLFYYMVSFTVFTDFLTQAQGGKSGIIGYLFTLIVSSGTSDGSGAAFLSARFWAAFSVMLLLVVPVKCLLDYLRITAARTHGLDVAQPCPWARPSSRKRTLT
jgi:hypothetical protein